MADCVFVFVYELCARSEGKQNDVGTGERNFLHNSIAFFANRACFFNRLFKRGLCTAGKRWKKILPQTQSTRLKHRSNKHTLYLRIVVRSNSRTHVQEEEQEHFIEQHLLAYKYIVVLVIKVLCVLLLQQCRYISQHRMTHSQ